MKRLYLVRHAKSEKGFDNITDFDRPLNERGTQDAALMGGLMKERHEMPDVFISSPAIRALSTAFIFARVMGFPWEKIMINEPVYEASEHDLLEVVQNIPGAYSSVMLFGHNPGFTDFANILTGIGIENVPTAAVVCMEFEVTAWKQVVAGKGIPRWFETPKKHR